MTTIILSRKIKEVVFDKMSVKLDKYNRESLLFLYKNSQCVGIRNIKYVSHDNNIIKKEIYIKSIKIIMQIIKNI